MPDSSSPPPLPKYVTEGDIGPAGYYSAYDHYSKLLRTWLVAYGIGGPVLLLTNESLTADLSESGTAKSVAILFLSGVVLQVLLATTNKVIMWMCYYGELFPDFCSKRRYKLCAWASEQFWIDFLADFLTIVLFSLATYEVFVIVTGVG